MIRFTVNIIPRGQARARHRIVHSGVSTFTTTYKAKAQVQDEEKLSALILKHVPSEPMQGPLYLHVIAYMPIPKSKSARWVLKAKTGEERPTGKPDVSNILKNVEDVMTGTFFRDDKQIVRAVVEKWYGDPARYEIELDYESEVPF